MLCRDSLSINARGGTELMKDRFLKVVKPRDNIQIYVSRIEEPLDLSKIRIYWAHDLPGDSGANFLKENWNMFHAFVFVSKWQMEQFISFYEIDRKICHVIENCLDSSMPTHKNERSFINLAYWSTPHRGLEILVPVFKALSEKHRNIHLDVFSSFNLYGWPQRDESYQRLFQECKDHPKITYHGCVNNDMLIQLLPEIDIFAYPSIWPETSCLCLIEAMSAGKICVHSDLAALPETSMCLTDIYKYSPVMLDHANVFYSILDHIIENFDQFSEKSSLLPSYVNEKYSLERFGQLWETLLQDLEK